jgi:membrane-anchored protein YejM (alkaline phosphatase superfamily)
VSAMRSVFLVSCVKTKATTCQPAEDLYQSDWFRKARCYVVSQMTPRDKWYILSAKHHLIDPLQPIEPYNETLNNMPKSARRLWAQKVLEQLRQILKSGDTVVILAGERYREFLEQELCSWGYSVDVPMRSLSIGQQLGWLTARLAETEHSC